MLIKIKQSHPSTSFLNEKILHVFGWTLPTLTAVLLTSCNPMGETTIGSEFHPNIDISFNKSVLTVTSSTVAAQASITATLILQDQNGLPYVSNLPVVIFSNSGGTSTGTFSATQHDALTAAYTTTFTGGIAGSPTKMQATINGQDFVGIRPAVMVTSGSVSLVQSLVTTSAFTVGAGNTITVTLTAKDTNGNRYSSGGLAVAFSHSGGTSSGSFSAANDHGDGTYTSIFTGTTSGTATGIRASIGGQSVTSTAPLVTVTGGVPTTIAVSSGNSQSAVAGSAVSSPLVVLVSDSNGNPLSGVTVNWAATSGGGSVSSSTSSTNSSGLAQITFTTGTSAGGNVVTASVPSQSLSVAFTQNGLFGTASRLAFSTQPSTSGIAGSDLSTQPVVRVQDGNGNTITSSSASVTLSLYSDSSCTTAAATTPSGANSVGGTATLTATSGTATFSGVSVDKSGTALYLRASSGVLTTACSNAMNIGVTPSTFSITTGNSQTGTAGSPLPTTLQVSLLDAFQNPVPSLTINWAVTAGGGSISAASSSNASGLATNTWTIGSTAGSGNNTATATVSGYPALTQTFTASGSAGTATQIAINAGNSQSGTRGITLSTPFSVLLKDVNNNLVTGATVDWATTAGGGSMSASSSTSNSSGIAAATHATGSTSGTNTVTATINGTSTLVTFTATVTTTAFTNHWPFDFNTTSSYTYDSTKINFSGGVCRLAATDQTDDDNTSSGFAGGSLTGAAWDASNAYVRLTQLGTPTNNAELDSSWTPKWSNLVSYWKMTGTGSLAVGDTIADSKGDNSATAQFSSGSMNYTLGKVSTAMSYSGANTYASVASPTGIPSGASPYTFVAWINPNSHHYTQGIIGLGDYSTSMRSNGFRLGASNQITNYWWGRDLNITLNNSLVGSWHHVAATWNGTIRAIYVDGALVGSDTPSAPNVKLANFAIGRSCGTCNGGEFFNGKIDEVAVFNAGLTASDIAVIYSRQSAKYSGTFTSRIIDAFVAAQSWTSLSWTPTLPFFKALPDYASGAIQNETSTDYASLVGAYGNTGDNNLMSGIVGLWHLDEAAGTAGSGSVKDSSGTANNGTPTNVTFGKDGKLNHSALMSVSRSSINFGAAATLKDLPSADFSISAWIRDDYTALDTSTWGTIFGVYFNSGGWAFRTISDVSGKRGLSFQIPTSGTWGYYQTNAEILPSQWYFVTAVWNSSAGTAKLYIDGTEPSYKDAVKSTGTYLSDSTRSKWIGTIPHAGGIQPFKGLIDEVALWKRALDPKEVLQLYRRGVNRIKFQVRNCTTPNCSDDSTGTNWKGPDGTNQTYFSELDNRITQGNPSSGAVKATLPTMTFSNFLNPVSTSRYFQSRTILESDDVGTGCNYGSGPTWCSPELKSVSIAPIHYDSAGPAIYGNNGVNFWDLAIFAQTLGSGGCPGGLGYNISLDKSTWYYWDNSAWVSANGTADQSNTASVTSTNSATFGSSIGRGTIYFKAYLKSSGTQECELDNVQTTGAQ